MGCLVPRVFVQESTEISRGGALRKRQRRHDGAPEPCRETTDRCGSLKLAWSSSNGQLSLFAQVHNTVGSPGVQTLSYTTIYGGHMLCAPFYLSRTLQESRLLASEFWRRESLLL